MRKVAVYCGTKNLYNDMLTAAKSLMIHSTIDQIYFLIEDNKFPYLLPKIIKCINVSNQQFFDKNGINFNSPYTYMALIRSALTKILPDEDLVLSLDVDTIIDDNIDELWDIDMTKKYIAAVREPRRSTGSYTYINFGVCLLNLKLLRESHKDDEIIYCLNHFYYRNDVQDCFSDKSQGRIYELHNKYNVTDGYTGKITEKKIIHFAGIKVWQSEKIIEKYRYMPLNSVIKQWQENCTRSEDNG